jgi:hypothetical protein
MLRLIPRRVLAFTARVEGLDQATRLALRLLQETEQWIVPDWFEAVPLTTAVSSSTASLTLTVSSTVNRGFTTGGYVALWYPDTAVKSASVVSTSSTTLVVTGIDQTWPAGTRVMPASLARWAGNPKGIRPAAFIAGAPVEFLCDDVADPDETVPTIAQIFTFNPHRGEGFEDDYARFSRRFDSPSHHFADTRFGFVAERSFTMTLRYETFAERDTFKAFWHQHRGAYRAFWCPSFQDDLLHLSDIASGDSTIAIAPSDYTTLGFPYEARRNLGIVVNNTVTHRRVTNATSLTASEVLTLSTTAGVNKTRGTGLLAFLLWGRFASDDLTIRYHNAAGHCDIPVGFVELPSELENVPQASAAPSPDFSVGGTPPDSGEPDPDDPDDPDPPTLPEGGSAAFPTKGTVGTAILFRVTVYDENGVRVTTGGDTVAASVTGAQTGSATVTDNNNGTYDGTFTPTATGTLTFAVTLNGSPINGSPFAVVVSSATVSPPDSTFTVGTDRKDDPTTVTITARDSSGRALAIGGATASVGVTGANTLSAVCRDNSNGTYTCRYTSTSTGTNTLAVRLNTTQVSGSPTTVVAQPATATVTSTSTLTSTGVPSGLGLIAHWGASRALPKDTWVTGTTYDVPVGAVFDSVDSSSGIDGGQYYIRIPSNSGAGTGPLVLWAQQNELPELAEIYEVGVVRFGAASGAANYENHPVGTKLLGFWAVGTKSQADNQLYVFLNGNGSVNIGTSFGFQFIQQNFINKAWSRNENTGTGFVPGATFTYALHMQLNDIGSSNGLLRFYLNGTRVMNYNTVQYRTSLYPSGFFKKKLDIIWGGGGTGTKTREDRLWVEDVKIYGRVL